MITTFLVSLLVIAAPESPEAVDTAGSRRKISYKKRVMVDPDYKPARSTEQIKKALRPAPRRIVQAPVVRTVEVHRPRYRTRRSYWPAVTFGLGYAWGWHGRHRHHYWAPSLGLHWGRGYYRHRYAHRRYGRSRLHFGFRYH